MVARSTQLLPARGHGQVRSHCGGTRSFDQVPGPIPRNSRSGDDATVAFPTALIPKYFIARLSLLLNLFLLHSSYP